ncbi:TRAP transporter large permease subunit [Nitratiruptor tergarcus]|uniref:TRAP transporter, DctM subunit n=1 Tax=Nitratiruptor tergarcus DSM 16512 TaxID=1069081 RepID=A0A1W1WU75_9BACT|nr:TRAP transporter large permease subunit [Nitratiruptor tergarcus]SMC09874.1 TRAP transporter, DctM subunit [Nitratiruptor tergarcus DSM 16512]
MNKISYYIDKINTFFGGVSAFFSFLLAFLVFYDASMRYLFHEGSIALQELEWYFFDLTFLLSAGYALKHDKHVRVDIFYEKFSPKTKATIAFLDNLLLIVPLALLILWYGYGFTLQSFMQNEASSDPGGLQHRWIIKAMIVLFAFLLLLQAISEMIKHWSHIDKKWLVAVPAVGIAIALLHYLDFYYFLHPAILMFALSLILLMIGFRVAFVFAGAAIVFALIDADLSLNLFNLFPMRIYGIMQNFTLMAVPLFILMGLILEKSNIARKLLENLGALFGEVRGGLAVGVVIVGAILAAATGIVGASVVMMSVITLPVMLKYGYDKSLASGTIAASGTLGQIIPPSIVLIVLGDVLSVSVGDLFRSAVVPGLLLVAVYIFYILLFALFKPQSAPPVKLERKPSLKEILFSLLPAILLIVAVLGSIFAGIATPTESAAMGVVGALVLAFFSGSLSFSMLRYVSLETVKLSAMIFTILIGATAFSLVFNEIGGEELVHDFFSYQIGSPELFIFIAMASIFLLGFFIDFVEICFVVIPLFVPVIKTFGIDPIWFGILVALNLQASFLTPPFGFALFYLKGSAGKLVTTKEIYRGVLPFIALQILILIIIYLFPNLIKVF